VHRLSIVIPWPVFNQSAEDTLVSVLQNRPANSEVIVVTAGKYDDPYNLDGEVRFVEEQVDAGVTRLVNRGFEAATADVVHVLMPGVQALDKWTDPVLDHFDNSQIAAVSPALLAAATDTRALSLGVGYWACGVRRVIGMGAKLAGRKVAQTEILAPCFEAGFYRRVVISALGGFDERMSVHSADVELGLALRQLGYHSIAEPISALVRGKVELRASSFQRARQAERLFRRYAASGAWIAVLHALLAIADSLISFPRPQLLTKTCGRIAAWFEAGIQERQQERVHRAQAYLAQITISQSPSCIRGDFSKLRTVQPVGVNSRVGRRAA
jgi:GT2 family glycosyltransferase